jgi:hypothetical protein
LPTIPRVPRIKKPRQLEADLQGQIVEYLERNQIVAWKNNRVMYYDPIQKGMRYGKGVTQPGQPDILGVIPKSGRMLAIETKGKYEAIRVKQETLLARLDKAGAVVIVARSVEDVMQYFGGIA